MHLDIYLNLHRNHKLTYLNLSSPFLSYMLLFHGSYLSLWHLHPHRGPKPEIIACLYFFQCTCNLLWILLLLPFSNPVLRQYPHRPERSCTFRPYNFPWVSERDKADKPSTFSPLSFPTYLHLTYIEGTMFASFNKNVSYMRART